MQNKNKSALMVGQSQQVLTIVRFLHHYAATSREMEETETVEVMRLMHLVRPKLNGVELGTLQLVR